jgi:ankyrin repeat protein
MAFSIDNYAQSLSQISDEHSQLVIRFFQWLAYSTRTLYIEELAEIATLDFKTPTAFDPNRRLRDPRDILTICPTTMITSTSTGPNPNPQEFKKQQQQVHLNPSVKQYLQSQDIQNAPANTYAISMTNAHTTIAKDSLTYLLQFNQPYNTIPTTIHNSHLLSYATNYWPIHSRLANDNQELNTLIHKFLNSGTPYLNWTAFLDGYTPFNASNPATPNNLTTHPHQLYYASAFGLTNIVQTLIDEGTPVDSRGPSGTGLAAASLVGHTGTVRLLVDRGADVNLAGPFGTPLVLAAGKGFVGVVEVLLEAGADVNGRGEWSESAVVEARKGGFEDVVRVLLGSG